MDFGLVFDHDAGQLNNHLSILNAIYMYLQLNISIWIFCHYV